MIDKYGNDLDYWYCCPICGNSLLPSYKKCNIHKKQDLIKSKHKFKYYEDKALELLLQQKESVLDEYKVFLQEEVFNNPLFSQVEYEKRELKMKPKKDAVVTLGDFKHYQNDTQNKNVPTCPTCQSTNVKKISDAKRAMNILTFGLFSKTAHSQFQCSNCGYKW